MIDLIMPLIEIKCLGYSYSINEDGTRNVDFYSAFEESFSFRFDISSLEKIIFRDGIRNISVDGKTISFSYDPSGEYKGIIIENDEYVWVVNGKDTFLDQCKKAYIKQKTIEQFALMMSLVPEHNNEDEIIYDEFE